MTSTASCTPNKPALALNTAENRVQFAVGTREKLLLAQETEVRAKTMQVLPPAVLACLTRLELTPQQLDRVAIVRGPGTFTGVRVGMSFALGLAKGGQIGLAGLEYLSLLATGLAGLLHGRLWVCTHARQDLVNIQPFSAFEGLPQSPAACLTRKEAVETMATGTHTSYILGSGVRRDPSWWQSRIPEIHILPQVWDYPRPDHLLQAAWQAQCSRDGLLPVYLRPSDAEVQLERIAWNRGVDPDTARR
ncbi:MAG: tRNA (adenosine(37)-N6)-threonylcarbamoyltransferase complex dimerization subunit type 1 TsaB, partial [Thermodesulfobacteriota bacterium]